MTINTTLIDKVISAAATLAVAAVATACFTGIESTPKITAGEVKRTTPAPTAENAFLNDVTNQNIDSWQPGKRFFVTDNKIAVALSVNPPGERLVAGDTLRFSSISDYEGILGTPIAELTFTTSRGLTATFRADRSTNELRKLQGIKIPFTVEESVVEEIGRRTIGHDYWITTSDWLDTAMQPRRGRKFVKVRVVDVKPGNETYPALLKLVDNGHQPADTFAMLITVGTGIASSQPFGSVFSFTDPHLRYPAVSDVMWKDICHGRVREGMTREEVRLSMGRPLNINRRPGYSSLHEIWTYEYGRTLIFEDGLLISSR